MSPCTKVQPCQDCFARARLSVQPVRRSANLNFLADCLHSRRGATMTGQCLHSKTAGAKLNFDFRASHFAPMFGLGLVLLTAGRLAAPSQVVAGQAFKGGVPGVSLLQDKVEKPPEKPQLRDFVGVWKATFQGKTFTALTMKLENDKLAGTLSTGEVDLADDGEVSNVNQEVGEARAIFDIKLDGQILSFKDKDGDDVNSLEM